MAERQESQGFFEMLWDCDHCETKGLLGKSQRHCPECGAKQNPDKRYFPKEGEQVRIDGHKYEGADRQCPACNAAQSSKAHNCTNCGAPQDGAREVQGVAAPVAPVASRPKRRWWIWVMLGVLVIGGIIAFVLYKRRTVDKQLVVTQHRWERSISIEQYGDEHEQNWHDLMPRDARAPSCHSKERSKRQVPDGETCKMEKVDKKDGTFEQVNKCKPKYRSEPVSDDWCSYTVQRWKSIDAAKLAGTGTSPAWPTANLPPAQAAEVLGAKRQGKQTEELTLVLGDQTCAVSEAVWRKYADGAAANVKVRASSGDIVCDSL